MRRVLPLLIVLTILVMAQSVVAMMPAPAPAGPQTAILNEVGGVAAIPTTHAVLGSLPSPMSLVLMMTGLSGLTAAGGRPARQRKSPSTH